jgi:hypothetical protein
MIRPYSGSRSSLIRSGFYRHDDMKGYGHKNMPLDACSLLFITSRLVLEGSRGGYTGVKSVACVDWSMVVSDELSPPAGNAEEL